MSGMGGPPAGCERWDIHSAASPARMVLMFRCCLLGILSCVPILAANGGCGAESPELDEAFDQLYNFNFPAAHVSIDRYINAHPKQPMGYAVRASAYLFFELDRLHVLESQFLTSDKHIAAKNGDRPDQQVRAKFLQAVDDAQSRAQTILAA